MISHIFDFLGKIDVFLWGYVNVALIIGVGFFFTLKSRCYQIRKLPFILRTFIGHLNHKDDSDRGIHPLQAFFASAGGCIGVGNVVIVCEAVMIGGPGAVFWIWVTAFLGCIIKYAEIYLGLRFRIPNGHGSYDGGPMYYLRRAFQNKWPTILFCLLLSIYGVEFVMFSVVAETISVNWHLNRVLVVGVLLALVVAATMGGIKRVGKIGTVVIPFFTFLFLGMTFWIIGANIALLPSVFKSIIVSAFTGHAAVGGFVGSTVVLAMSRGMARGCYSGDIGIGNISIIHSESSNTCPEKEATAGVTSIILDTFMVCTLSLIVILVTGIWKEPISPTLMVQEALSQYFPYMDVFMSLFIFVLGYTTIISFFCVGMKCMTFLFPNRGKKLYYGYAMIVLPLFAFLKLEEAIMIMSISGGLLLVINVLGIFRLRNEIKF